MTTDKIAEWLKWRRTELRAAIGSRRDRERETAPYLNLFRVLGVTRTELCHSAFLAHLLDPNESHGQGALFLRGFFDILRKEGHGACDLPERVDGSGWTIMTEEPISDGRLDILVCGSSPKTMIVIENKVDAEEGEHQLKRYGSWLAEQHDVQHKQLVYLTLSGEPARSAGSTKYLRLSFQDHVLPWIDQLSGRGSEVRAASVRECLRQYGDVLREITTGEESQLGEYKEMAELLLRRENVEITRELISVMPEVEEGIRKAGWESLKTELKRNLGDDWDVDPQLEDDQPYLPVYPAHLDRTTVEPPLYVCAQQVSPGRLYYGISWRNGRVSKGASSEALEGLRGVAGLPRKTASWLAYERLNLDIESQAFGCEVLKRSEPLPQICELSRKLSEIIHEHGDQIVVACAELLE